MIPLSKCAVIFLLTLALLTVSLNILAQEVSPSQRGWTSVRGNGQNTGQSPARIRGFTKLWEVPLPQPKNAEGLGRGPLLVGPDNTVYAGIRRSVVMDEAGQEVTWITAIEGATGKIRWKRKNLPLNYDNTQSVLIGDLWLLPLKNSTIAAIETKTGNTRFTFPLEGSLLTNGDLVAVVGTNNVQMLQGEEDDESHPWTRESHMWDRDFPNETVAAFSKDVLLVADKETARCYALDLKDGHEVWSVATSLDKIFDIAVGENEIFATGTRLGTPATISLSMEGAQRWHTKIENTESRDQTLILSKAPNIYVKFGAEYNGAAAIYRFTTTDGEFAPHAPELMASIVTDVAGGMLAIPDVEKQEGSIPHTPNYLLVLAPLSGRTLQRIPLGICEVFSGPVIGPNGTVYVVAENRVMAFGSRPPAPLPKKKK